MRAKADKKPILLEAKLIQHVHELAEKHDIDEFLFDKYPHYEIIHNALLTLNKKDIQSTALVSFYAIFAEKRTFQNKLEYLLRFGLNDYSR